MVYGDDANYSDFEESKLFEFLQSEDPNVYVAAIHALGVQWSRALIHNNYRQKVEKKANDAIAPPVKRILDLLKAKGVVGTEATKLLPLVPADLAHPSIIAKALNEAAKNSEDLVNRIYAAIALRDSFWIRGEKLDNEAIVTINDLLLDSKIQKEPTGSLQMLLIRFESMKSDGLPFKDALEKLAGLPDANIARAAKNLVGKLSEEITPQFRKDGAAKY